jgi:hypothetical protein
LKIYTYMGGAQHTTVTAAKECLTPEQIEQGKDQATYKAFERYFQREARDAVQVPHPKEKRPKLVPLIDEDIENLESMPRGLPDLYCEARV